MIPVFITCRDRVSDLRHLVAWLERAGTERIILLDNDSTWEPLLAYLRESPHEVRRLGHNYGSQALWLADMLPQECFVLTDPDVLPTEDCPLDAVQHLADVLDRHPSYDKAGLGLYLEDVPGDMSSLSWERTLHERELEPGVYDSFVDTTFALYRPGRPFDLHAIRTGAPYLARHLPWYRRELDDEHRHYVERAIRGRGGTNL